MTALKKYARLECTGLWRPLPDAQRREVVVTFGDASLVLSDGRTQQPLAHWSLAAVQRRNPGQMPALFAPASDTAAETLELEEPAMIEAIETVRVAVARRRPRRGRLRLVTTLATLVAIGVLGTVWLPGALVDHTVRVVPFVSRQAIGADLLVALERFTGAPCRAAEADEILARLAVRLFDADGTQVVILRDGLPPGATAHLPGRIILADRRLVESHDGPDILAGHLLAERLRAEQTDPLERLLQSVGIQATLRLLATGTLPADDLAATARDWLTADARVPAPEALLPRFANLALPSTPYALSLDPTGTSTLPLIEADPVRPDQAAELMPDADWLAVQGICNR